MSRNFRPNPNPVSPGASAVPSQPPTPGRVAPVNPGVVPGGASGVPGAAAPASAMSAAPAARNFGPKPKSYRVINGGFVVVNGMRTAMRAGKEVDERSYDLTALRRQGIKLELIEEEPEEVPEAPTELKAEPKEGTVSTEATA